MLGQGYIFIYACPCFELQKLSHVRTKIVTAVIVREIERWITERDWSCMLESWEYARTIFEGLLLLFVFLWNHENRKREILEKWKARETEKLKMREGNSHFSILRFLCFSFGLGFTIGGPAICTCTPWSGPITPTCCYELYILGPSLEAQRLLWLLHPVSCHAPCIMYAH